MANESEKAAIRHLAAFNSLAGGLPINDLVEVIEAELTASKNKGQAVELAQLLEQEFPDRGEGAYLATTQPDLIGEGLIIEALSGPRNLEAKAPALVARAYALTEDRAAIALMRLLQDFAYALEDQKAKKDEKETAQRLMTWLAYLVENAENPLDLIPLANALPVDTLILREQALKITEKLAEVLFMLHQNSEDDDIANAAATWQNNLSVRLSALGEREAALKAAQEAVDIRRVLAAARPDAFTADLAMSLNNLANRLSALGQREAALKAAQEAVDIRRVLAAARPDAFTADLAMSLNNLANRLSALGQREAALEVAQEAVDIRRGLAAARPDAFTTNLSVSLGALTMIQRNMKDHTAALISITEAIAILRPLFLSLPQAVGNWMDMHLRNYIEIAKELGQEPDMELLGPIIAVLQKSNAGGDEG
jgi:tetratricopeptide (TPR) repeat protein